MQPIDALTPEDKENIRLWLKKACGEQGATVDVDYLLRVWNEEKAHLFHLFGDKLKFTFKHRIDIDCSEFEFRMSSYGILPIIPDYCTVEFFNEIKQRKIQRQGSAASQAAANILFTELMKYYKRGWLTKDEYNNIASLTSYESLYHNSYQGETFSLARADDPSKQLVISKGIKPMRALRKVFSNFALLEEDSVVLDILDMYQNNYSSASTNLHGEYDMVVSIHPLDLLTLSDNNCNWSTCLSMLSTKAQFSSSITEVLNSPMLAVAYMKSAEPYIYNIDNKSWRTLVVINDDFVLIGKNYPYLDTELNQAVLTNTLKHCGLSFPHEEVYSDMDNIPDFEREKVEYMGLQLFNQPKKEVENLLIEYDPGVYIFTNGLYNDFAAEQYYSFLWAHKDREELDKGYLISGPRECLLCGETTWVEDMSATYHCCSNCLEERGLGRKNESGETV